jgi:RNA polymerase sigma-70 factor (ECF subfamily)
MGVERRREEFERVALPHLDRMYQFALRLTRNPADARDVVQEAYYRAWRFWGGFKPGSNARAWLYKILYHVFLAERAGRKRREAPLPEDEGADEVLLYNQMVREGGWKDPLDLSPERFGHLLGDEVRRALDRLPNEFKFPILLCDVDGMGYAEIARVIGCPVGTVRSRIARGRKRLQRDLVEYARSQGYFKAEAKR